MSSIVTEKTSVSSAPKAVVTKRTSIFFGSFLVGLVSNLILVVFIFTLGVSTGFEGQPSFNWDQFGNSVAYLFGGIGSLLALIGGLAIVALTAWIVYWLSTHGHHKWVLVAFVVGIVVGGFILWRLVDWSSFGFGFVPFIGLLVYTAFWALVAMFVIPTFNLSLKRDTIREEVRS